MVDEKSDVDEYLEYLAKYAICAENMAECRRGAANRILDVIEHETLDENGVVDFKDHRFIRQNIVSPAMIRLLVTLAASDIQDVSERSHNLLADVLRGLFKGEIMYGTDPRSPWHAEKVLNDKTFQDAVIFVVSDLAKSIDQGSQMLESTASLIGLPLPKQFRCLPEGKAPVCSAGRCEAKIKPR